MRGDNTILFLVIAIVLLHFLLGIGWVLYKVMHGESKPRPNDDEDKVNNDK